MQYYFAPLESISSYPLRNTHVRFFPGIDKYFSPFVSANEEGRYSGITGAYILYRRLWGKIRTICMKFFLILRISDIRK